MPRSHPSINNKSRRTTKTKIIFKVLALAMMIPAMLLTTACSSEDVIGTPETTAKKGFELPVTINVTRQIDNATTRTTYNESTKKLGFSTGDKLFVKGSAEGAGKFAGTLSYASEGSFSGTITTENQYSGTADDLLSAASDVSAKLLPADYETYGFLSISGTGYEASVSINTNKAFATTKALAVEQFSYELTKSYSDGFALSPFFAVANFTITGLSASTDVDVALTYGPLSITGRVKTDGSGTARFAMGLQSNSYLQTHTLTVGGRIIALPTNTFYSGKIYNITRSATSNVRTLSAATKNDVGKVVGMDGNIYDSKTAASAAGTYAVAMIAYVGNESNCSHGLAISLDREYDGIDWDDAMNRYTDEDKVTGGTWRLPSYNDWRYMLIGCGSKDSSLAFSFDGLRSRLIAAGTPMAGTSYWTSTKSTTSSNNARIMFIRGEGDNDANAAYFQYVPKTNKHCVRNCLAF